MTNRVLVFSGYSLITLTRVGEPSLRSLRPGGSPRRFKQYSAAILEDQHLSRRVTSAVACAFSGQPPSKTLPQSLLRLSNFNSLSMLVSPLEVQNTCELGSSSLSVEPEPEDVELGRCELVKCTGQF